MDAMIEWQAAPGAVPARLHLAVSRQLRQSRRRDLRMHRAIAIRICARPELLTVSGNRDRSSLRNGRGRCGTFANTKH